MEEVISIDRLVCWRFRLGHDGRLPRAVRSLLHAESRISWTLPITELEEEE